MSVFVPLEGEEPEEDLEHIEVSTAFDELDKEFVDGLIDKIVLFIEALSGNPFHDYQKGASRRIVESVVIRDAEVITALASRQSGKDIDVEERILTANRGWVAMGDISTGDVVFGPDGGETTVLAAHPVEMSPNGAYRVTLTDGRALVVGGEHLWGAYDARHKNSTHPLGRYRVLTTHQLLEEGLHLKATNSYRWGVPRQEALKYSAYADLPVDPYFLGAWLGDGNSYSVQITCHRDDLPNLLEHTPYHVASVEYQKSASPDTATVSFWLTDEKPGKWTGPYANRTYADSLGTRLTKLGLLKGSSGLYPDNRKHIPEKYLAAGYDQRLELLRGLMDTDGSVHSNTSVTRNTTRCEYSSKSKELAEGVQALALSLGYHRVSLIEGDAYLNGKVVGRRYRVCFTLYEGDPSPFHLQRKTVRIVHGVWKKRSSIKSIEKVEDRLTRCITVDREDGLFLAGRALVPTHNSELVANTVAGLMVILPRLAKMFPKLLGVYKDGFWVGLFAPVEGQVETLYSRVVTRLTSERALEILSDPEIDDKIKRISGVTRGLRLEKSGSYCTMMTANPKAKVESKTYHLIVLDEAQESDDVMVSKSLAPMLAHYKGSMIKLGTPSFTKNNFYKSIQLNKRLQTRRGARQNHYEWTWKEVIKEVPDYGDFIKKEMLRIGEDSDEFQMSYQAKFILERGMFVTQTQMDELADVSMETVKAYHNTPVVVGIDPARKQDSTVVTVVYVDWDRPDEFGYFHHRVLNWLEIQGDDWESQYHQIVDFLGHYNVLAIGVDANGVGDAVADRLARLIPRAEVIPLTSSQQEQSDRFKHLQALIQRGQVAWPGNAKARRLRTWKRFMQQMTDAEKDFKGSNFLVHAPDEPHAHDDYVDSLSIACALTKDATMPKISVSSNPFY